MRGGLLVRRLGYSGETSAASFGVFRVRGTASIRHCLHTVQRVLYSAWRRLRQRFIFEAGHTWFRSC
jgi:hypothetical protein